MIRLITRSRLTTRIRIATLTVAALALALPAATTVQAARLPNCSANGGVAPCFELVWVNGVQRTMTFVNLHSTPSNAPTDAFYVLAPQTGTPQGRVPFRHDHLVDTVRPQYQGHNGVRYHSFFVLCSAHGIASGGCVPAMTAIPGLGIVPLARTVNGRRLTTVAPIESPANAGLLTLFDTGGVIIATLSHGK